MTMDEKKLRELVKHAISDTLADTLKPLLKESVKEIKEKAKTILSEALVLMPKTFVMKTEYLTAATKENHFKLYKGYVDSFNDVSSKLDTVGRDSANNPNDSAFRHLKLDEQSNMNAVKLHELYFNNVSDLHSEIRGNSIAYMRISRDFGSFENWQFDFRATGMAATEGWTILYFDPFKQKYLNVMVEKHTENIPVCGIPILVVDTFHHAWFRDYAGDKINYLNAMMKEINWNVVETRMMIAEKANLHLLYAIQPVVNSMPEQMLATMPSNQPPIDKTQVIDHSVEVAQQLPKTGMSVASGTPSPASVPGSQLQK